MDKKLLVGWSEVDITPDSLGKEIPLYGQYYARVAKGIHSRLKGVFAAISSGDEYFITGSIDNCGTPRQLVDLLREETAKRIPGFDKSKAMIVGDSLSSDILGGKQAGILTCWVNPTGKTATEDLTPDYEIPSLSALETMLENL